MAIYFSLIRALLFGLTLPYSLYIHSLVLCAKCICGGTYSVACTRNEIVSGEFWGSNRHWLSSILFFTLYPLFSSKPHLATLHLCAKATMTYQMSRHSNCAYRPSTCSIYIYIWMGLWPARLSVLLNWGAVRSPENSQNIIIYRLLIGGFEPTKLLALNSCKTFPYTSQNT